MAQQVFVDIPGIGTVEAKNAASEHTLNEILRILKKYEKKKLGGAPGGKSGTREGDDNSSGEQGSTQQTASSFAKLRDRVRFLSSGFSELSNEITNTIDRFSKVGDSLTGAAAIFSNIPILGSVFGAVAGAAEGAVGAFQSASSAGATFGGSVNRFARSASEAGMTLADFGNLLRSSGEGLLGFGATTEDGAKRFSTLSRQLRTSSNDLYALGFSTQEINQGLANYGKLLRTQGIQGKQSNDQLVKGAKSYLKEMDALAKITGVERSAKEAEMMAAVKDAQFQGAMANQSEEVRKSFLSTLGGLAGGMQGPLGNFAKDILATGTATTEENQKLLSQMPLSAAMLVDLRAKMQRGEAVTEEERNRLNNLMAQEGGKAAKQLGGTFAAAPEFAGTMNALTLAQSMQKDALSQATAEQVKAAEETDKLNAAVEKNKQVLAGLSNSFQMVLASSGILDTLMTLFKFTADIVSTYLVPAFKVLTSVVSSVVGFLSDYFQPAMGSITTVLKDYVYPAFAMIAAFLVVDVLPILETLAGVVRDYLWPALQSVAGLIADYVFPVFKSLGSFIADNLTPILLGLGTYTAAYLGYLGYLKLATIASTVAEFAKNAALIVSTVGLTGLAAAAWAAAAPFLALAAPVVAVVAAVAALVVGFKYLYDTGWSFGTAIDAVKDNLQRFWLTLVDAINGLLSMVPNFLGGISKEEAEKRKAVTDAARAELDAREQVRDAERERVATARSSENKQQQRDAVKLQMDQKILGQKQDEVRIAERSAALNLNDPNALLKGLAKAEGSAFATDPKYTGATPSAQAAQSAVQTAGAASGNSAVDPAVQNAINQQQAAQGSSGSSGSSGAAQDPLLTAINRLNSNMERMVSQQTASNRILDSQLRAQKDLTGAVSNDLFQYPMGA